MWPLIPVLLIIPPAVAFVGWAVVRKLSQRRADHMRTTSMISLPSDVTYEQLVGFFRALYGMAGPKPLEPIYAIATEAYADIRGLKLFVSIPGHVIEDIEGWLEHHTDAVLTRVRGEDDLPAHTEWERGIELGVKGLYVPLMIKNPEQVALTLYSAFMALKGDEAVVLQWIMFRSPAQSPKPDFPHEDAGARKAKVSEAMFRCAARIAAKGEDADRLVRGVYAGLSGMNAYGVTFYKRHIFTSKVTERVRKRSSVFDYRILVNAQELAVVVAWPFSGIAGATHRAKRLMPTDMVPVEGIVIGGSNYPKTRGRIIALPPRALTQHQWVIGPTGSGKSVLLLNEAQYAMRDGLGLVVIEPKGDLARDVLSPKSDRYPIMLVLDEFQKFLELNVTVEDMLPLARSYELAVVAAHQHLGQLSRRPAVLAEMRNNARTKIAFGLGPEDAGKLEDHFKPLTKLDLQHLPQYEVAASLMTEDGQAPVVTARTFPAPPATGHGAAAQALSRAKYGKPIAEIQEAMRERHKAAESTRKRPSVGRVRDE